MRKGLVVMPRDKELLRYLSYGPGPGKNIFRKFFAKEAAKDATRRRVMMRRINKIKKGGLIAETTSPLFKDRIYVLLNKAAHMVAAAYGEELSNISTKFNQQHIDHDLYTAICARKIVKEAMELELTAWAFRLWNVRSDAEISPLKTFAIPILFLALSVRHNNISLTLN